MNCYNHTDVNAVSSCGNCNKSLCKNCYDLGVNGVCSDCIVRIQNKKFSKIRENHAENIRKSYVAVFIGAVIGFFIGSLVFSDPDMNNLIGIFIIAIYSYAAFSIYWGIKVISQIFDSIMSWGFLLIFTWPLLLFIVVIALFIGMFVSIPMFIVSYTGAKKNRSYNKPKINY
jgi:hypothetical protein